MTTTNKVRSWAAVLVIFGAIGVCGQAAETSKESEKGESERGESKNEGGSTLGSNLVSTKNLPFGLDLAGPVNMAGSDTRSANFQQNVLPSLTTFLSQTLGERKTLNDSAFLVDPAKLTLKTDADVRVYFVGEGAAYQNTLGYNTEGSGVKTGDPQIIFPNASSPVSTYDPARTTARTTAAPLLPGDFSNLGNFSGGTRLDFFLIANGAQGGRTVYSTDSSVNPDGINHVVSFAYAAVGSPYLILGFEDLLGGGDKDFNDVLIAIDIGVKNVAALVATPEPALVWVLGSFVGLVVWRKRGLVRGGASVAV